MFNYLLCFISLFLFFAFQFLEYARNLYNEGYVSATHWLLLGLLTPLDQPNIALQMRDNKQAIIYMVVGTGRSLSNIKKHLTLYIIIPQEKVKKY